MALAVDANESIVQPAVEIGPVLANNSKAPCQYDFLDAKYLSCLPHVLPQLNLEFAADRIIRLSEGGLYDDTISTNICRP
ncbi:hypothetical protein Q31b_09270 [Novipirellula aureliae]|uniref:Uncharacterized protein n=1 Tax=Novipirellula aureliae TaxID=2527966 RepID=A0A5C6EDG6_9BACT|nr:hypothetical protein Q31b_09270 [Novipirellula aureliae]